MQEDGSAYIVLEYLEGEELQLVIDRRGALPPEEAVDYMLQALEALAHAHALGIVHRDLKPSNIFLSRGLGGTTIVKVFDFGISKAPQTGELKDQSSTASQMILGTPSYMAPEQARSAKDVDARADVWALGVTLYRLLTNSLPFLADNVADMLAAILVQPHRPMRAICPELSPDLEAIVGRCLAKERELRFSSVGELAQALARHASASGRVSVDRVTRTLGVPKATAIPSKPVDPPAPAPRDSPDDATQLEPRADRSEPRVDRVDARTDAGWMEASVASSVRAPAWRRPAAVVAALAIGASGLSFAVRSLRPGATPAAVAPVAISELTATPSPSPAPEPPPAATGRAAPAPAAVVDASAPTSPEPAPTRPTGPSPTVETRAVPAHPAHSAAARGAASAKPAGSAASATPAYDVLDQRN